MFEKKKRKIKLQPYVTEETAQIIDLLAQETGHFQGVILDKIIALHGLGWAKYIQEEK